MIYTSLKFVELWSHELSTFQNVKTNNDANAFIERVDYVILSCKTTKDDLPGIRVKPRPIDITVIRMALVWNLFTRT